LPEGLLVKLKKMRGLRGAKTYEVRSVRQQRNLSKCTSADNWGESSFSAIGGSLDEVELTFEENPEVVGYFSLTGQQIARLQMDLSRIFETAQFVVVQRGQ